MALNQLDHVDSEQLQFLTKKLIPNGIVHHPNTRGYLLGFRTRLALHKCVEDRVHFLAQVLVCRQSLVGSEGLRELLQLECEQLLYLIGRDEGIALRVDDLCFEQVADHLSEVELECLSRFLRNLVQVFLWELLQLLQKQEVVVVVLQLLQVGLELLCLRPENFHLHD